MPTEVDATLQVEEGVDLRPLNVEDFKVAETGAASEAKLEAVRLLVSALGSEATLNLLLAELVAIKGNTDGLELSLTDIDIDTEALVASLANVFTELGQKLEAGDITGLATATNQLTGNEYLRRRFSSLAVEDSMEVTTVGDNIVHLAAADERLRLTWLGMSTSQDNPGEVLAVVKVGAKEPYRWNLGNPGAFSRSQVVEGELGGDFVVNLSNGDNPVDISYTLEVF